MRKIALAFALLFGLATGAAAQAPPAVPALPDSQRLTTYSISGTTCACAIGFQIYASGTDVDEWIQVYVNGVAKLSTDPTFGWSLSSVSPGGLTGPRPITNAILTFNAAQTGTIVIVGDERPRRLSQFPENRGVAARDLNQAITDAVAVQRELWDKSNRSIVGQPGDVLTPLPSAASRAGQYLCFDTNGNPTACQTANPGTITLPSSSVNGNPVCFNGTTGKSLFDCGYGIYSAGMSVAANSSSSAHWEYGPHLNVRDFGAACDSTTDDTTFIQLAITTSQNNNGIPVFLPAFCHITAALNITGYTKIFGTGNDSGLKPALNSGAIIINTTAGIVLKDFSIQYASQANNGTVAISVDSPSGANVSSYFDYLNIIFANYGIIYTDASLFTISNSVISHSAQSAIVVENVRLPDGGDSTIFGNWLETCGSSCLLFASGGGLRINNNKINVAPVGIRGQIQSGAVMSGLYMIGNSIEGIGTGVGLGGSGAAIQLDRAGTTGSLSHVVISSNESESDSFLFVPNDVNGSWIINMVVVGNTAGLNNSLTTQFALINSTLGFVVDGNVVHPSSGGTTKILNIGSSADHGSVGINNCAGTCVADSISSTNTRLSLSMTPNTQTGSTYSVLLTDYYIIANNSTGTLTLTLLAAASYPGQVLKVKTTQAQTVVSASSNVVPLIGGAAGTAILAGTAGKWAELVSDGLNWVILTGN